MKPLPGVSFKLLPAESPEHGSDLVEIRILSDYQLLGYVGLDGRALEIPTAFDAGWYCTRDLGKPVEDGGLLTMGRCDLSVNRNGLLLPFADVEVRLREIEGVEEAAVAAGPETIRGRSLVAFCVLRQGIQASWRDLRARYAERAPAFSVPDSLRIVPELPKLPNGKIDRRTLASMAAVMVDVIALL